MVRCDTTAERKVLHPLLQTPEEPTMKCVSGVNNTLIFNDTLLFSNCSKISVGHIHQLAMVRGVAGMVCFVLCLATFLFELVYICRKKESSTLQRFFVYLTFSSLLYSAALSFHLEHYFLYDQLIQCYVCEVVGFFDQYNGSVQLMLTLGIAVKLFHKVFSFCFPVCFERKKVTKGCLSRHHFLLEALYVVISFALPCTVIWFPFIVTGPGDYGTEGAWCWIQVLKKNCDVSKKGFLEQLLLWYVPYVTVSLLSLLCIVAIVGFLICVCVRRYNRKKVMVAIMDILLLLPFLIVFCCVCIVEVLLVILLRIDALKGHLDTYAVWMSYAIITPIGAAIIPIAFFCYFLRKKRHAEPQKKLQQVSRADAIVRPSERRSFNSHTSQQERSNFLSPRESQRTTKYGSMDEYKP